MQHPLTAMASCCITTHRNEKRKLKRDIICNQKIIIVYHFQKKSGNTGRKINGTRLFGSFQRKISRSNSHGTSEKIIQFSWRKVPIGNSVCSIFWKSSLILGSGLCAVFRWMEHICKNSKRDSGTKFTGPWPDRFAHVNGKQAMRSWLQII